MKLSKLLTGFFFLICFIILMLITLPIVICLMAYDLGNPLDSKDRMGNFVEKVWFLGRIPLE